jgi:hypothetical protein
MAKDPKSPNVQDTPSVPVDVLAAAFSQAIELARPKPVDVAQIFIDHDNADPVKRLRRKITQCGAAIQIRGCSDDLVKHLNELEPGVYLNGRVTVEQRGNPPHESLDIQYPRTSVTDRVINQGLFSSFSVLLQLINAEQKARAAAKQI